MNNNIDYKKIEVECIVCKTKFEIWISTANYSPEIEEKIKSHFYKYCPVCKILEELKNREEV